MFSTFRARLIATVILLVAVTAGTVGALSYVLVRDSLRDRLVDDAVARSEFNIAILASEEQLAADAGRAEFEASGLADRFLMRGIDGVYVEFPAGGDAFASSPSLVGSGDLVSPELRRFVQRGDFGFEFLEVDGAPTLVVAGRRPPAGPDFYFFFPAESVARTLSQVRRILTVTGVVVLVLGAMGAGLIARRVLHPVAVAGRAAQAMAGGDLTVRLPAGSGDEFGRWAEAFNRMAASLERQIAALVAARERERRFVADVSHELRTPLTALVNEAAMLGRHLEALPETGRHVGEMLIADVGRMRRLVDDLLEISRLDAAGADIEYSYVDLDGLLRAVVADRHPAARLRTSGLGRPIPADRRALERIVGNLLDNARRHAPGAAVVVSAGAGDGFLRIVVADDGPGVPEEDLPHLFERFHTADSSRRRGSGLGLAIARRHARHLGGDLTVRRGPEGGLVFELVIPVTDSLLPGDLDATEVPESGPEDDTHRGSTR